jgi:hypothetical protein
MENEIDFHPTDVDVVSTKLRTWNTKHSGNVFYTELVLKMINEIKEDDQAEYRRVAEEVVDILTIERGGRFLKLREGEKNPNCCILMGRKQSVNKAIHALRTAWSKADIRSALGDAPPKKKKVNTAKLAKNREDKSASPRHRSKRLGPVEERVVYQAIEGNQPIKNKYVLNLISAVCNQSDPATAHRVLDDPIVGFSIETEPDKERLMRLQVSDTRWIMTR